MHESDWDSDEVDRVIYTFDNNCKIESNQTLPKEVETKPSGCKSKQSAKKQQVFPERGKDKGHTYKTVRRYNETNQSNELNLAIQSEKSDDDPTDVVHSRSSHPKNKKNKNNQRFHQEKSDDAGYRSRESGKYNLDKQSDDGETFYRALSSNDVYYTDEQEDTCSQSSSVGEKQNYVLQFKKPTKRYNNHGYSHGSCHSKVSTTKSLHRYNRPHGVKNTGSFRKDKSKSVNKNQTCSGSRRSNEASEKEDSDGSFIDVEEDGELSISDRETVCGSRNRKYNRPHINRSPPSHYNTKVTTIQQRHRQRKNNRSSHQVRNFLASRENEAKLEKSRDSRLMSKYIPNKQINDCVIYDVDEDYLPLCNVFQQIGNAARNSVHPSRESYDHTQVRAQFRANESNVSRKCKDCNSTGVCTVAGGSYYDDYADIAEVCRLTSACVEGMVSRVPRDARQYAPHYKRGFPNRRRIVRRGNVHHPRGQFYRHHQLQILNKPYLGGDKLKYQQECNFSRCKSEEQRYYISSTGDRENNLFHSFDIDGNVSHEAEPRGRNYGNNPGFSTRRHNERRGGPRVHKLKMHHAEETDSKAGVKSKIPGASRGNLTQLSDDDDDGSSVGFEKVGYGSQYRGRNAPRYNHGFFNRPPNSRSDYEDEDGSSAGFEKVGYGFQYRGRNAPRYKHGFFNRPLNARSEDYDYDGSSAGFEKMGYGFQYRGRNAPRYNRGFFNRSPNARRQPSGHNFRQKIEKQHLGENESKPGVKWRDSMASPQQDIWL